MGSREVLLNMKIEIADSYFKRLKGLMFRRPSLHNEGLLLAPCGSIHMFFMRFAIDVIFVDKHFKVVDTYHNLLPWKIAVPKQKAFATFEVPVGTIDRYQITVGDRIVHE